MPFTEDDRRLLEEIHTAVVKPDLPGPDEPDWSRELLDGQPFSPSHPTDFKSIDVSDAPAGTLMRYELRVEMAGEPDFPSMQNLLFHLGANKGGAVKHRDLLLYSFWQGGKYTWRQGIGVPAGEKTKDVLDRPFSSLVRHNMDWLAVFGRQNEVILPPGIEYGSPLIGGSPEIDQRGLWMHLGGKPVFENNEVAPVGVTFESVTLRLWYDCTLGIWYD